MYSRFDNTERAKQYLSEALTLLGMNAPAGDPAFNKTRAYLGSVLYDEDQVQRAAELTAAALESCTSSDSECAKARAYADIVSSQLERQAGHQEVSVRLMRSAVGEATHAFGEQDPETTMMLVDLAITERNSGHLVEAHEGMDRAVRLAQKQTLRARDRIELWRSKAIIDYDLGDYASARVRLQEILNQPVGVSERSLDLRLLGMVEIVQGDARSALQAADQAIRLATGANIPEEVAFATQVRALALAILEDKAAARSAAELAVNALRASGSNEDSPDMLRAHRFHAEVALRAGDLLEARKEIEAEIDRIEKRAAPSSLELGQALELLGCILREMHDPTGSIAAHRRARMLLSKQLPADHPFLTRNTLYIAADLRDRNGFADAAQRIGRTLPPDSTWRTLMDAVTNPDACSNAGRRDCTLVL
jgi:tetratricopeptide (TPR) repeat protein